MATSPLAPPWLDEPADANSLDDRLWSSAVSRSASGEMTVAGVPISHVAREYGTPLFIVDEEDVRARATRIRETLDREFSRIGTTTLVYYAAKAALNSEIARWVVDSGLNIDVCSGGELALALAAGVKPARLALHGNNKSIDEIDRGVAEGIGEIVIDSVGEIDRVVAAAARHDRVQSVRLRVNNGVHAQTHDHLATAHEDQKFGIALADADAVVATIRSHDELNFLGLHCHIGSQIFAPDGFCESARRLLAVHARLLARGPVPELNLGGGFGISYTLADDPVDIEFFAEEIASTVANECARLKIAVPIVAFEPGRAIVGPSTLTLYEVGTVKDVLVGVPARSCRCGGGNNACGCHGARDESIENQSACDEPTAVRRYVSVDGGMSDNARPALYGANYSVRIANRVSTSQPALVRLAGKHCESGDIIVNADYLPSDVTQGDLVAVPGTGAYCGSLASNYNYVARAPVVAVRDGVARVLVRRETTADVFARDEGLVSGSTGRNS